MKLNAKSLTPLYQQVCEEIRASIQSGNYVPGDKIPSEAELSERYSVSRVTVRRAIEELVGEGYLTSRQGKGTFVNQRKLERKLRQQSSVTSFTELCAGMGMVAGACIKKRHVVPINAEERLFFGMGCEKLILVSRIRTADGIPIMEENDYYPFGGFEFLLDADLEDVSIFDVIRQHAGRSAGSCAKSTIEMILASAAMATELETSVGTPLFFEHAWLLDEAGKPMCESKKHIVGSRYMFEL